MRDDARTAVRAVEEATKIPVLVTEDPSLRTMAIIKPGRSDAPAHILRYNPKFAAVADYLIAYQCGFALRIFNAPAATRFELSATIHGRREAGELSVDRLARSGMALPTHTVSGLRDQFFDGLMSQLRSMPVGLRVDAWVRREFPGLHEQQDEAARLQLEENQQVLAPRAKQIAPELIYAGSAGMSAAFACFWSRTLADVSIVVPYRVAGLLKLGENLLRLADEIPEGAENDKHLVQAWGDRIGVAGWFELTPFGA